MVKESIDVILDNSRINGNIKYNLLKRKEALDNFINKYDLIDFILGSSTFEDIEKSIPKEPINIYDKTYSHEEFKNYLRSFDVKNMTKEIEQEIEKAAEDIVNNYGKDAFFSFFLAEKSNYSSKVWINALCLLFLIKWIIYKNDINYGSKIRDKVDLGLEWIKDHCNWKDNNLFLYSISCESKDNFVYPIKIYETSLSLQVLLRTYNKYKPSILDFDINPTVEKILLFKDTKKVANTIITHWPADIDVELSDVNKIVEKRYAGDVGATSHVIQFFAEIFLSPPLIPLSAYNEECIKNEVKNGAYWLKETQAENGSWADNSIGQTCEAIQALLKLNLISSKIFIELNENEKQEINNCISKGLGWLSQQFGIEDEDSIICAWPSEDITKKDAPCCKNTALALSTFLKAGLNINAFIVVKPLIWLLKINPAFKFDNIYKYCSMIDYLKTSDRQVS